jgi:hypothetical protein
MKLILEVKESKAKLLLEFLRSLSYVKVTPVAKSPEQAQLAAEMEEAVEELKLVRAGKKKTRTLTEFLDAL